MHTQINLFGEDLPRKRTPKRAKRLHVERGCATCPLNGRKKVFGEIKGREVLVLAMCPGENEERLEIPLVGKAGKLFWHEMEKVGLMRSQCDVDNHVRCRPVKKSQFGNVVNRNPTPLELHCCSIHTEAQLAKAKPKVILLLGEVSARQYLGKQYRGDRWVYWDEERNCRIVCTFHPSYLLRGVNKSAWGVFRAALCFVKHCLEYPGRFDYLKAQDYRVLSKPDEVESLLDELRASKRLPIFDIEDDTVNGERVVLSMAWCNKPGIAYMTLLDHPENPVSLSGRLKVRQLLIDFLADKSIRKGAWWGIYDIRLLENLWDFTVHGYVADGAITQYLSHPDRKDYQLDTVSREEQVEFAGFKDVIADYVPHFAKAPIEILKLRNCGDADLAKRQMLKTIPKHSKPLVKMLCDASYILAEMSEAGQWMDYEQATRLEKLYTKLEKKLVSDIAMIAGDADFNPTDDNLRWLLVKKLKLNLTVKTTSGKRGDKEGFKAYAVGKGVLEKLYGKHPVIDLILKLRFVRKLLSTYIAGFRYVADLHHGLVKTRFKIWGTRTGRISSGSDRKDANGNNERVNFQNVHGDPNAKNLLVSTLEWRRIVKAWEKI